MGWKVQSPKELQSIGALKDTCSHVLFLTVVLGHTSETFSLSVGVVHNKNDFNFRSRNVLTLHCQS